MYSLPESLIFLANTLEKRIKLRGVPVALLDHLTNIPINILALVVTSHSSSSSL